MELLPVSQSSDPMKKDLAAKAKEAEEKQKRKKRKRNVKFSDDPFEWLYQKSKKLKKRKQYNTLDNGSSFFCCSERKPLFSLLYIVGITSLASSKHRSFDTCSSRGGSNC